MEAFMMTILAPALALTPLAIGIGLAIVMFVTKDDDWDGWL
jgi:hypothetical protein